MENANKPSTWLILLCLGFLFLASGQPALASEPAARVIVATGKVSAVGADGTRDLRRRSPIEVGESVVTGDGARAQLRFSDGAIVSLDANSELLIEAYTQNPEEPEKSRALLRMVTGGLRSITGAIAEGYPEGYEVETPLASIGVRGTDFRIRLSSQSLAVGVWDGAVQVSNPQGSVTIGPDLPFRFAVVQLDKAPEAVLEAPVELAPETDGGSGEQETSPANTSARGQSESPDSQAVSATVEAVASPEQNLPAQQEEPPVDDNEPEPPEPEDPNEPGVPDDPNEPTTTPGLVAKQDRLNATLFTQNTTADNETFQTTFIDRSGSPEGAAGISIGLQEGSGASETQDFGVIFPEWSLESANKVAEFPVYWGSWDGQSEVLTFFSNSPNADGSYSLESYDVNPLAATLNKGLWAYTTEDPMTVTDIVSRLPGATSLTFSSGTSFSNGTVIDSQFSDGFLDPSRSFISFDLDLMDGVVTDSSGGYEFTVISFTGLEQVWSSEVGASDFGSDLSGDLPSLNFTYINTTVTNSDGSLQHDGPAGGITKGMIIPSEISPELFGFLGSIDLNARDANGIELSSGSVTFLIKNQ